MTDQLPAGQVDDAETVLDVDGTTDRPVDPPDDRTRPPVYATVVGRERTDRRPVVPMWLRSKADALATGRFVAGNLAYALAYHLSRSPKYTLKVVLWSPVGVWRTGWWAVRWVFDAEQWQVRRHVAEKRDPDAYRKLVEARDRHVRHRLIAAAVAGGVTLIAVLLVWALAPTWVHVTVWVAVLLVLARVGRPADRPLTDRVINMPGYRKLTAELVRASMLATGYGKRPEDFQFLREITRVSGGYNAGVTLPHGVTGAMVADRRERVAGALRLPLDQVWVRPGRHAGEVDMYVLDEPIASRKQPPWPLLKSGRADVFAPIPLGTDERGEPVKVTLMYANLVVGAVPRSGKTVAVRLVTLACALDPRVRLSIADLKGTGDLAALQPVAQHYIVGDDDDDLDALMAALRAMRQDMRRRTRVIRDLPRDLCPDSKVTPTLADNPALGLAPALLVIDECQVIFTDDRYGAEAEQIVTDLVKRGPATGIVVVLSTQKPDAKSLPTGITSNASMRLAFRLMDQASNDQVLGTSQYKQGIRATQLTASDKGVGWLLGALDDPTIVRVHYVDGVAAEKVVTRAVQLRGGPVDPGSRPEPGPRVDLLADVRAVWSDAGDRIWSEMLVERLAQLRPDVYGELDVTLLNAQLRAAGVEPGQIHRKVAGKGITRYGLRWSDLPDSGQPKAIGR